MFFIVRTPCVHRYNNTHFISSYKWAVKGGLVCGGVNLECHVSDAGQSLVSHLLNSCHRQTIPVAPYFVGLNELSLTIITTTNRGTLSLLN